MRTLIVNACVVDGSGARMRPEVTVVLQDHLIEDIVARPAPYYDRADVIIDARGGYVLPGLVNHHAHGLTRGPLMIVGEPPLSDARVTANLDRLLRQGVTTALNVDGFPTVEDAVASSKHHPLSVKVSTLHTPANLSWVGDGPLRLGGIQTAHRWSLDQMLNRGALAIGEAGPGLDPHWTDYALVPEIVRSLGGSVDLAGSRALRAAVDRFDGVAIEEVLTHCGAKGTASGFQESYEAIRDWSRRARASLEEAIVMAEQNQIPLICHHTAATHELQLASAKINGERHIAAHSNFQCESADEAVQRAGAVKKAGGLVDIMSGDCFGSREFQSTPDITYALLAAGHVDLLSTDYGGGFWDSMLLLVEHAAAAGAVELEEGVRLCTSSPANAIPGLAPDRGYIRPGLVGDIVITAPGHVSRVRHVLISGRCVRLPDNDWS